MSFHVVEFCNDFVERFVIVVRLKINWKLFNLRENERKKNKTRRSSNAKGRLLYFRGGGTPVEG